MLLPICRFFVVAVLWVILTGCTRRDTIRVVTWNIEWFPGGRQLVAASFFVKQFTDPIEQTVLLSHWFHCVKLPTNVLSETHPFFNLFKREKDGERIPHLFFCDPDGSNKSALPGDQPQGELWATMFTYLDPEAGPSMGGMLTTPELTTRLVTRVGWRPPHARALTAAQVAAVVLVAQDLGVPVQVPAVGVLTRHPGTEEHIDVESEAHEA